MITDFFILVAGWLAGGLVNYLSDVLPLRRRFTRPFCVQCNQSVPWWNYLFWWHCCPSCGRRASLRVWLVSLIYICASLWLWEAPPGKLGFVAGFILLIYFGVVVVIDLEHRLILHPVSIFGALLGLAVGIYLHGVKWTLLGGIAGFGVMWLLYKLGELVLIVAARLRGQKVYDVALGFGDVNLSGVLGLILGWPGVLVGLGLAIFIGGIVSLLYLVIMILLRRYRVFMAVPYGPFLVVGAMIILYFREALLRLVGG